MAFQRQLLYKIYEEDGTYISTLTDVISDLSISKEINGGDSDFTFVLSRKMDDFSEGTEIDFNHRVKVYLKDEFNTAGTTLVAYGYIITYQPYLKGKEEGVEVTCLSAISKLSNDFYRTGTSNDASELGIELTNKRVDEMMTSILTHYRSIETNSMIAAPSGLDQTTDNAGALYSFDLRFFNMKHIDALREASKYLAKYKDGGYWYYWRINTAGSLILKNVSATADHKFIVGKHITDITGNKTMESVINRVYFWNEKGTVDPDYLKLTANDTTSQGNYDIMAEYITDSAITNSSAASLLTESRIYDKKDPVVKIQVTLNGEYDLASISPGQTCQIFNVKNNPYKVGTDSILIIQSVQYDVDSATLELSEPADDFEDIVEEERQRLDKEMRWFGYITQQLTAAQLGPANRTWTSTIVFSATVGADAYRKVDWTAGIVYIPTSSNHTTGKRVIVSGTTGLMSAATDYYIYLDEVTINTSAAATVSGTGTMKAGGDSMLDASKAWTVDDYKGYIVTIGGQTRIIKSNTATVLTIEESWTIADSTAAYTIKKMTLDVTSDKTIATKNSSIIFSNVRSNSNTGSGATITPGGSGSSSTDNYVLDGTENIAYRSITADSIQAHSITANEIVTNALIVGTNVAIGTAFPAASAGDLAYLDIVETAKLGTTVIQGGYIKSSLLTADNIVTGTLTGRLIRTTASGTRAQMEVSGTYANSLTFYYNSNIAGQISNFVGNLFVWTPTGAGTGLSIYCGDYRGLLIANVAGSQPVLTAGGSILNDLSSNYDLGSSSYTWRRVYTDNITLGGVNRSTWPSSGVSAHGDLTGVTADQHHTRSHTHSSSSDGTALAPFTCWASSANSGSSSGIRSSSICTTAGRLYYGSYLMFDFQTKRIDAQYPVMFPTLSSPPGAASSFTGAMYYDDTQTDLVFSNGSDWYKVTAEII